MGLTNEQKRERLRELGGLLISLCAAALQGEAESIREFAASELARLKREWEEK